MKFTESWLREHLNSSLSIGELCGVMSSIGIEVEDVVDLYEKYHHFIIAEIVRVTSHPNSNRLKLCWVFDGHNELQVVCGASNVAVGAKVVFAPLGSIMPNNGAIISKVQIRGEDSFGMICSASELDLVEDKRFKEGQDGIIILNNKSVVGKKFATEFYLEDKVINVSLTPNRRQDCASVRGIARDLAAADKGRLKSNFHHKVIGCYDGDSQFSNLGHKLSTHLEIAGCAKNDCHEIVLFLINGLCNNKSNAELPSLIQIEARMAAIGKLNENYLVTLSNYVMFDRGRPNHIYDADKIDGSIMVRYSEQGEEFIPLKMEKCILPAGLLVVADQSKILSLAGVIGGELSKVDAKTTNVVVEIANFNFEAVRHNRIMTRLSATEASMRFESRIDAADTSIIADQLYVYITESMGGQFRWIVHKSGEAMEYKKELNIAYDEINSILGCKFSHSYISMILERLGFEIQELAPFDYMTDEQLRYLITIPSWRLGDINCLEDVAEEVMRLHGLEHIDSRDPFEFVEGDMWLKNAISNKGKYRSDIRQFLTSRGLNEVITWSFYSDRQANIFGLDTMDGFKIVNPISNAFTNMRQSMLPQGLEIIRRNASRGLEDFGIFEIGKIYYPSCSDKGNMHESEVISVIRSGKVFTHTIHGPQKEWDFYDIKGDFEMIMHVLEQCFNVCGCPPVVEYEFISMLEPDLKSFECTFDEEAKEKFPAYYHPACSAVVKSGRRILGYCGVIHPSVCAELGIASCVALEIFLESIQEEGSTFHSVKKKPIVNISDYQAVYRDLSFIVPNDMEGIKLIRAIECLEDELIKDVLLFDVYSNDKLGHGNKSMTVRITLQSCSATLNDAQIEESISNIIVILEKGLGIALRKE